MRVLVLSETDALCGPMAAAFLRDFSISLEVVSAGMNPTQAIDPLVVEVMHESLIDLETYVPCSKDELKESDFDGVYQCPKVKKPKTLAEYRALRDFIKNEVFLFYRKLEKATHP